MTSARDLFVLGAIILAMLSAVVTIGVALWELGHAWWTPEDRDRDDPRGGALL